MADPGELSPNALQQRLMRILLGGKRKYTRLDVAEKAGVSEERSRRLWRLWRALGQHLSRLAEWQVHMLWTLITENKDIGTSERQIARLVDRLLPELEKVQNFVWRRHLAAYASRPSPNAPAPTTPCPPCARASLRAGSSAGSATSTARS